MTTAFAWHFVLTDSPEGATETHTTAEGRGCDVFTQALSAVFSTAEPSALFSCCFFPSFDKPRRKKQIENESALEVLASAL